MKTSYEVLKEVESRIEKLIRHVDWLNKQDPNRKYQQIQQEISRWKAQINCLKSLWAFIKGE